MRGYDYSVLKQSGVLDKSANELLQKTGYSAVAGVYEEAELRSKK